MFVVKIGPGRTLVTTSHIEARKCIARQHRQGNVTCTYVTVPYSR